MTVIEEIDDEVEEQTADAGQQEDIEERFSKADAAKIEGNQLLQAGKLDEACSRYEEALKALQHHSIQGKTHKDRADQVSLAVHLNLALANMKRDEACHSREFLGKARLNLHMSLTLDPENVKALYRRGMVQVKLAKRHEMYDDTEARAALDDFEKALRIDPSNADVRRELHKLRSEIKAQSQDLKTQSKKNWAGVFQGKGENRPTELKKEKKFPPKDPVRADGRGDSRRLVAKLQGVPRAAFQLPKRLEGLVLQGPDVVVGNDDPVTLEFHEGWCQAICGAKDSGASLLGRALLGKTSPSEAGCQGVNLNPRETKQFVPEWVIGAIVVLTLACCYGTAELDPTLALPGLVLLCGALFTGISISLVWQDRQEVLDESIQMVYLTSNECDREQIPSSSTVQSVLGDPIEKCPIVRRRHGKQETRDIVVAMLAAAGFKYEEKGPEDCLREKLTWGQLMPEQRQLIYSLRCLAQSPDLLICDDPLDAMDEAFQVRFLRMLRHMKREIGMSILYISSDPYQLKHVADAVAFVGSGDCKGQVIEKGPVGEVFDFPRHLVTEAYVQRIQSNSVLEEMGQALTDRFQCLVHDPDLEGKWLPKKAKKKPARERRRR